MVGDASLKCGSVLGPAALVVVSGEELGWEPNGWDWDPSASGLNTELAPNSSSNKKVSVCILSGCSAWSGWVTALGFGYPFLHPVRVKGSLWPHRGHVRICGHSSCLSFHAECLSFKWQLFRGSLPTVRNFLVFLSLNKTCPVNDLGVALKIIERVCQGLLGFPFRVVFFSKLVSHVQP